MQQHVLRQQQIHATTIPEYAIHNNLQHAIGIHNLSGAGTVSEDSGNTRRK
jgi:hypothetical protein